MTPDPLQPQARDRQGRLELPRVPAVRGSPVADGRDHPIFERSEPVKGVFGHPATVSVLITDHRGHVLIVHPAKDEAPWQLPGGLIEAGESPAQAAEREVREELGLTLTIRPWDLLAVEWLQATRPERRDRFVFLFTGPELDDGFYDFRLQRTELDALLWAPPAEAHDLLHPRIAARLDAASEGPRLPVYREIRTEERTPAP